MYRLPKALSLALIIEHKEGSQINCCLQSMWAVDGSVAPAVSRAGRKSSYDRTLLEFSQILRIFTPPFGMFTPWPGPVRDGHIILLTSTIHHRGLNRGTSSYTLRTYFVALWFVSCYWEYTAAVVIVVLPRPETMLQNTFRRNYRIQRCQPAKKQNRASNPCMFPRPRICTTLVVVQD